MPDPPTTSSVPVEVPWRAADSALIDAPEEHFEPPEVQLPPGEDLGYWAPVLAIVGGLLALLYAALVRPANTVWWSWAAVGLLVAGFGLLVVRLPREPSDDDDSGARV